MRDVLNYVCEVYRVYIDDEMACCTCLLVSAFPQSFYLVAACASLGASIGHTS